MDRAHRFRRQADERLDLARRPLADADVRVHAAGGQPFGAALALTLLAMVLLTMMVYLTRLKPQSGRR